MRVYEFRGLDRNDGLVKEIERIDFKNELVLFVGEDAWVDFSNVEVMQFTGLYDKNGVKIFEGDVVRVFGFTTNPKTKEKIPYSVLATVKYSEETACFLYLAEGSYVWSNFRYTKSDGLNYEVIGNIHQEKEK